MNPHPRTRKAVKWGGAVVTALLFLAWIGSAWWELRWYGASGFGMTVGGGRVFFARLNYQLLPEDLGFDFNGPLPFQFGLVPSEYRDSKMVILGLPFWPLVLILAVITGIAWHLDCMACRRSRR